MNCGVAQLTGLAGGRTGPVAPQDSLEPRPDPLDGPSTLLVPFVGADRDPLNTPRVEGMCQEEQFGFGVHPGSLHRSRQPGAPDFHLVGQWTSFVRTTELEAEVHEPSAPDDRRTSDTDGALNERQIATDFSIGTQHVDVLHHRLTIGRNMRESECRSIGGRKDEIVDVLRRQGFE